MNTKVIVEANQQGRLITKSPNNPLWGWIRVVQTRNILDEETGILRSVFCSALVQGSIEDLKQLKWKDGMELDGKIIFRDSMTPYRKTNPERDCKIAGKTKVICSLNGKPIYRKYFYVYNPDTCDVFIQHDTESKKIIKSAYSLINPLKQENEALEAFAL